MSMVQALVGSSGNMQNAYAVVVVSPAIAPPSRIFFIFPSTAVLPLQSSSSSPTLHSTLTLLVLRALGDYSLRPHVLHCELQQPDRRIARLSAR